MVQEGRTVIRVGFVIHYSDSGWMGGLNYMRTLLASIQSLEQREIQPVLFFSPKVPESIRKSFPADIESVALPYPVYLMCRASRLLTGVDWPLEATFRRHRIDVASHSMHYGHWGKTRTIEWIPDLQHRRLPHFFTQVEINARERSFRKVFAGCDGLLLSSQTVRDDIHDLYAISPKKTHVLHFVAHPDTMSSRTSKTELFDKYAISGPYFHLPNQFWAHKNHRVVIEALAALNASGKPTLVLCTGHTHDWRQPDYFKDLMAYAIEKGVEKNFRILGLVPIPDLYGLMEHAVALINPSYFEGWSTTVEESKALGKGIILSDLAVHREQNPPGGYFFTADDAEMLATHMQTVLENFDPEMDTQGRDAAFARHRERFLEMGKNYQRIVQTVLR